MKYPIMNGNFFQEKFERRFFMIEIQRNMIKLGEDVLKYATNEELEKLREIAKNINERIRKDGANA